MRQDEERYGRRRKPQGFPAVAIEMDVIARQVRLVCSRDPWMCSRHGSFLTRRWREVDSNPRSPQIGQLQVECDFLAGQPAISRFLRGGR
jgi:hypothetical protein